MIPATSAAQCGTLTPQGATTGRGNEVVTTTFGSPVGGSAGTNQGGVAGGNAGNGVLGGSAGSAGNVGGVAGISATLGSGQEGGGVLGIAATRVKGALPFTGFALWSAVLIGASLLIGGAALVRRSRGLNTAT